MMDLKFATAGTRVTIDDASDDTRGVWHIIGPSYKRGTVDLHRWVTVRLDGIESERHEYYAHANGYGIAPKELSHAPRAGIYNEGAMSYPTFESLEDVTA